MEKLTDEERRKKSREGRMFDRSVHQQSIERTMIKAEQIVPDKPCIPSKEVRLLRARLILEEALETILKGLGIRVFMNCGAAKGYEVEMKQVDFGHCHEPNLVEIADGCADLSVVTIGTLSACGISDIPILQEVDRANWEKVKDGLIKREDGKYLKPEGWKPPDIEGKLKEMGLDG